MYPLRMAERVSWFLMWMRGVLCAGTYTLTVTDNSGLTTTESYVINEPSEIIVNINASPQSCNENGIAEAVASGGSGAYFYLWDAPGNPTTNIITDLPAGTYSVTPSSTFMEIKTENIPISNARLYNVIGNLVFNENYNVDKVYLETAKRNVGTYFIEVKTPKGIWREKIIIIRQ